MTSIATSTSTIRLEIYHEQIQQQLEHHEQQQQQQQQKEADGQQAQVEEPVAATPPLLEPASERELLRDSYPWEPDYELGRDPYMRLLCLGLNENEIRRLLGMPPRDSNQ